MSTSKTQAIDDALTAWVNDPGYDNKPFVKALEAQGYTVVKKARIVKENRLRRKPALLTST